MNRPTRTQPAPRRASVLRDPAGFTLIEVLIAVIVIGLGMIGISALFAGTARQQQLASQLTRSTTASRNAEAQILEKFRGFRGTKDLLDCVPAYSGNPNNIPIDERLTTEWRRLNSTAVSNVLSLAQQPAAGNTEACSTMYFERTLPPFSMLNLAGLTGAPISAALDLDGFNGGTPLPRMNANFPNRSVVPEVTVIDVYVATNTPLTDPEFAAGSLKFTYLYDPDAVTGDGACNKRIALLRPDVSSRPAWVDASLAAQGWANPDSDWRTADFIEIDTQKCPIEATTGNNLVAFINAMRVYAVNEPNRITGTKSHTNSRYIERIEVRTSAYRSLDVLSLRERVLSEPSADGTRDTIGTSVLIREASSTTVQVALFTYSLQSDRVTARYIPKEDDQWPFDGATNGEERDRPIRRTTIELVRNIETQTYWAYAAANESWIGRFGQVLLFSGDAEITGPNAQDGAENPCRVVRVIKPNSGVGFWCELDRPPRSGGGLVGNQFVEVADTEVLRGSAGGGIALDVYGVNAQVQGRADNEGPAALVEGRSNSTTWHLTPIDLRVFTISK